MSDFRTRPRRRAESGSYSVWRGSDADVLRLVYVVVYVGGVVGAASWTPLSVRVVPEEVHHVAVSVHDAVALLVAEGTTCVASVASM